MSDIYLVIGTIMLRLKCKVCEDCLIIFLATLSSHLQTRIYFVLFFKDERGNLLFKNTCWHFADSPYKCLTVASSRSSLVDQL